MEVSIIKPVSINAENIDAIFVEQHQLIKRTINTDNSGEVEEADVESSTIGNTAPNNESVRKMISSLMFV